ADFAHQQLPFELLVGELASGRDLGTSPLFQVMLVAIEGERGLPPAPAGLSFRPWPVAAETSKFDLTLSYAAAAEGLAVQAVYRRDLFDRATAARLLGWLEVLASAVLADPDRQLWDYPLLGAAERHQLLWEWSRHLAAAAPEDCLHALVEAQAARAPEAVAVSGGGERLTYGELDAQANQLAHYLLRLGVGPETRVGIHLPRSLDLIVALLAVLKAGGAYLPLDPVHPPARKRLLLEEAQVAVLITEGPLGRPAAVVEVRLPRDREAISAGSRQRPASAVGGGNAAYVLYTSGSTGTPKGVVVEHHSAAAFCAGVRARCALGPGDRLLQFAAIGFDVSVEEIFGCLAAGATLVLRDEKMMSSIAEFLAGVAAQGITVLVLPTAYWHEVCAALDAQPLQLPAGVRLVVVGGEQALWERLEAWQRCAMPPLTVINAFGPTEATVSCVWGEISGLRRQPGDGAAVPIGRPVHGMAALVLGPDLEPVPAGIEGELYLGGGGLARGYLELPAATAEAFLPNPWSEGAGERLYRTGDFARWHPDGTLEFRGRADRQVKVRGHRVELAEVESVLRRHPEVADAVVAARPDGAGLVDLVAYVVPAAPPGPPAAVLREHVAARLPAYMVPARWHALPGLPRTTSDKLDRRALAELDLARASTPSSSAPPRDDLEWGLAEIWQEVLRRGAVAVTEDFFALGGHSLLGLQLMARVERRFGVRLPLAELVEAPTIERLALRLRRHPAATRRSALVALQPAGGRPPFFLVHPIGGNVLCYLDLARRLGPDQPVYGLQSPPADEATTAPAVETMAASYLAAMRRVQARGPYRLGGWSFGGVLAYEMALQLRRDEEEIELLAVLDAAAPGGESSRLDPAADLDDGAVLLAVTRDLAGLAGKDLAAGVREALGATEGPSRLSRIIALGRAAGLLAPGFDGQDLGELCAAFRRNLAALRTYRPGGYDGRIELLRAAAMASPSVDATFGWGALAAGCQVHWVDGDHYSLLRGSGVERVAALLADRLQAGRRDMAESAASCSLPACDRSPLSGGTPHAADP
ncbi:MAG TPA: amino acid adenylation domain-containing protein, partial [Thermoanaerobaculia bacterium]